ncbi:MAG: FlgD immunoglobulin-like domain containing protein, partial [Candidatus Marinimicrobia bacterium]|nr:FlgD immunoglobulin-like domain containing protein [Candidatus Neomarinimicrobiota bacterium]
NNGGVGAMIAGVDTDGDGRKEIFLVNDNWNDGPSELIPRIYKLEYTGTEWEVVWSAVAPVKAQNTWPPLEMDDLDGDGKMELIWMPVNNFAEEANPYRVLIYEQQSTTSDIFGVDDGEGGYAPNAAWTIVDEDNINLRPFSMEIADIKGDGVKRIIFADRSGNSSHYHFGVITVSNIPDAGDGSETWEIEATAQDFDYHGDNKWDVAVINNSFYTFDEVVISKTTWNGTDWEYNEMSPLPGGITFDAAQVADIDGNGTKEIIVGEYFYGDETRHIWILEEDGDSLKRTPLFAIHGEDMLNGGYLGGGDQGDIDGDGYLDFVFGSRYSGPPNAMIFLVSYKGGDIHTLDNWELAFVDTAYVNDGGLWNVISVCNIDADQHLEVLYTSSISLPGGDLFNPNYSAPIIVMDPKIGNSIDKNNPLLPFAYKLEQNFPNPFNPSTTLSLTIPKAEHVKLTIYDITGKEVKVLVNSPLNKGTHSFVWDGTDMNGKKVASGSYVYRMEAGNVVKIRNMTLLK